MKKLSVIFTLFFASIFQPTQICCNTNCDKSSAGIEFYSGRATVDSAKGEAYTLAVANYTRLPQKIRIIKLSASELLSSFAEIYPHRSIKLPIKKDTEKVIVETEDNSGSYYIQRLCSGYKHLNIESEKAVVFGVGKIINFPLVGCKIISPHPGDNSAINIQHEILHGDYTIPNLQCQQGDIMVDVGAHIGVISIMYAKLYPELTIYAFEPNPESYKAMVKNLEMNSIRNVIPINKAVTSDGRTVTMDVAESLSAGGVLQDLGPIKNKPGNFFNTFSVPSITLKSLFKAFNIKKCKILKIDCEGSEYEILQSTPKDIFEKTEYMIGEFHTNDFLESKGYFVEALLKHCERSNPKLKKHITVARGDL